ncbi:hypothetical protein Lal_00037784 [Lupinus albus]|nr:hypothetical protein Lal_00037784 [Lupinus albus]
MKLFLFMMPLVVAVVVFVLGPNVSTWIFIGKRSFLWSSVNPSYLTSGDDLTTMEANVIFDERKKEGILQDNISNNQSNSNTPSVQQSVSA